MKYFFYFLIVTFFSFCKPSPDLSKESILVISKFSGTVNVTRDGAAISVKMGDLLKSGDVVSTGSSSFVDLEFPGGALIRVKEKSRLSISSILGENGLSAQLELVGGKAHIKIKEKLKQKESFRIKTPTMVAGVRGTEFSISDDDKKIMVLEGTVAATQGEDVAETAVEGGKKVSGDNLEISPLTEEEKRELLEDSKSLSGLTADVLETAQKNLKELKEQNSQLLQDQKESNRQNLEDQKARDREAIETQKAEDQQKLEDQKTRDKESLDTQKEGDQQKLEEQKTKQYGKVKDLNDKSRNDLSNQKDQNKNVDSVNKDAQSDKGKILDKKALDELKKPNLLDSVKPTK